MIRNLYTISNFMEQFGRWAKRWGLDLSDDQFSALRSAVNLWHKEVPVGVIESKQPNTYSVMWSNVDYRNKRIVRNSNYQLSFHQKTQKINVKSQGNNILSFVNTEDVTESAQMGADLLHSCLEQNGLYSNLSDECVFQIYESLQNFTLQVEKRRRAKTLRDFISKLDEDVLQTLKATGEKSLNNYGWLVAQHKTANKDFRNQAARLYQCFCRL